VPQELPLSHSTDPVLILEIFDSASSLIIYLEKVGNSFFLGTMADL
jgi:hypothetical protein